MYCKCAFLYYSIFFRQLHLIISMLVHGDDDTKAEASINKEKEIESISVIVSIFQSIKCSKDIVDATKSKVSALDCYSVISSKLNWKWKENFRTMKGNIAPSLPVFHMKLSEFTCYLWSWDFNCQAPSPKGGWLAAWVECVNPYAIYAVQIVWKERRGWLCGKFCDE